jgi:hypothetical protein
MKICRLGLFESVHEGNEKVPHPSCALAPASGELKAIFGISICRLLFTRLTVNTWRVISKYRRYLFFVNTGMEAGDMLRSGFLGAGYLKSAPNSYEWASVFL